MQIILKLFWIFLASSFLAACGGEEKSSEEDTVIDTTVDSLYVSLQRSLVDIDDVVTVSAEAYNQQAELIAPADRSAIEWHTDNSAVAQINNEGVLTAVSAGVVTVWAESEGVQSNREELLVAAISAEVIPVSTEFIVESPLLADLQSTETFERLFTVVISDDLQLSIGEVITSTGDPFFAGEIVDIESVENGQLLTLQQSPVSDIFDQLVLQQTQQLDLEQSIAPEILANYEVTRDDQGAFIFHLNESSSQPRGSQQKPTALSVGPFQCTSEVSGNLEAISVPQPVEFVVTPLLDLVLNYDSDTVGLEELYVTGTVELGMDYLFQIQETLEGSVDCEIQLFVIEPELPTVAADIVPLEIPVSAGFRIEQQLTQVISTVDIKGNILASVTLGTTCIEDFDRGCIPFTQGSVDSYIDMGYDTSDLTLGNHTLVTELTLKPYVATGLRLWGFNLQSFEGGLSQHFKTASINAQILNPQNETGYDLSAEYGFVTGQNHSQIWDVMEALGMVTLASRDEDDAPPNVVPLSTSPLGVRALKDRVPISGGISYTLTMSFGFPQTDDLRLQLSLLPTSLDYWMINSDQSGFENVYNIDQLVVYRVPDPAVPEQRTEVLRQTVDEGQGEFTLNWTRPEFNDEASYYVFVSTHAGANYGIDDSNSLARHEYLVGYLPHRSYEISELSGTATETGDTLRFDISHVQMVYYDEQLQDYVPASDLSIFYATFENGEYRIDSVMTDEDGNASLSYVADTFELYTSGNVYASFVAGGEYLVFDEPIGYYEKIDTPPPCPAPCPL